LVGAEKLIQDPYGMQECLFDLDKNRKVNPGSIISEGKICPTSLNLL
jgi:hypothetical protein